MSWKGVPVFGATLITLALMMLVPALYALSLGASDIALNFAYSALVTAFAGMLLVAAMYRRLDRAGAVGEFAVLIATFSLAPVAAAAPVSASLPLMNFGAAYFEMVSMITTTGATMMQQMKDVNPAILLWRGMIAWSGGLVVLVMAYALLAPRNLGGFEVRGGEGRSSAVGRLTGDPVWAGGKPTEAAGDRLAAALRSVLPVYSALTVCLTSLLMILGHSPLDAFILGAGVLSTSGLSNGTGPAFATSGLLGEIVVAGFFILIVTRHTYGGTGQRPLQLRKLVDDPEMRILFVVVLGVSFWLYVRHWVGVFDLQATDGGGSLRPLWGGLFTVLSFATTTGYVSQDWASARMWSGMDNPSLILFGLAIMGGGIATTAGGVKLLRAYALFKHGGRELERLVRPSSVSGSGARKRGLRREGALIAWVFVMVFLVAIGVTMLALSLTGMSFESSLTAAVSALSNTGQLFPVTTGRPWHISVPEEARAVLVVAMVLGRVEILALIAMLNCDNWR